MASLSSGNTAFLFLEIVLALAGMLIWAFWSLEQWREKQEFFHRLDPFKIRQRR